MKRNFRIVLIAALLVAAPLLMLAQNPPHPNGGVNGPGGGPVGGGAPIDGGISILILLGIGYGAKKAFNYTKKPTE